MASPHRTLGQLADLLEGRLQPRERAAVRAHLSACAACTAELAWLERVMGTMRTDTAENPPAHVVARAVRAFRMRPGADDTSTAALPAGPFAGLRPRLVALLRFDSGVQPLAAGLRAAAPTGDAERQLTYEAGDYELELRLAAAGERWTIGGQVLGPDGAGRPIEVRIGDDVEALVEAVLNDLSEFTLPPVPSGVYAVLLRLSAADLVVENLELPPP